MAEQIKFYGINETLFYLKNYEKELFNEFKKKLADAAQPLVEAVNKDFPQSPFRNKSNWHTSGGRRGDSRFPAFGQSRIKAVPVGMQRKNARGQMGILRIQQMDGGNQIFDTAGSRMKNIGYRNRKGEPKGERIPNKSLQFIMNLDKHTKVKSQGNGFRSRRLFTSVKKNESMVENAIIQVVKEVDGYTTKRINAQGTR